jgi:hypothetical protein
MKITIEFSTENAAFEGDLLGESRLILERAITCALELATAKQRQSSAALRDSNGNTVGHVEVKTGRYSNGRN